MYTIYKRPTSNLVQMYKLKVRKQKTIYHENGNQKKAGVAILIKDKIDLKIKRQEGKLCNDQGTNFKNTIIVNIYAPNIGEPQYKGKS